jgi:hypothetical protein
MPNRIDIDFDERGFQAVRAAAKTFLTALNPYTRITSAKDRKDGQSMGESLGWLYVQKAFEILTLDRELFHKDRLIYTEFERDIRLARQLLILKKDLNAWVGDTEGTFIMVGKDLMEQANIVRKALEELRRNQPKYEQSFQDLNFLYENRAKMAQVTAEHNAKVQELEQQVATLMRKPS